MNECGNSIIIFTTFSPLLLCNAVLTGNLSRWLQSFHTILKNLEIYVVSFFEKDMEIKEFKDKYRIEIFNNFIRYRRKLSTPLFYNERKENSLHHIIFDYYSNMYHLIFYFHCDMNEIMHCNTYTKFKDWKESEWKKQTP